MRASGGAVAPDINPLPLITAPLMASSSDHLNAEEFVSRLMSAEAHDQPSDDCKASELEITLPPWYNENKYKVGQRFYWDNLYGLVGANLTGLVTIIAVPSILNVLIHSKRSSSTYTAYRRYASTMLHVVSWHKHQLKPGSESWKSLLAVRTRHLQAGKNARTVGVGTVSQRDLALTQFGFVGYALLQPDRFGLQSFEKDSWEGFVHFWRTIGYMIGMKDKYNLCIGTVEESTEVCRILMEKVFAPLLEFPPEYFEHMAYVIFDGMWSILPLVDPKANIYLTRMLAGVPGYVYTEQNLMEFRKKLKNGEVEKQIKPVANGWHNPKPRPDYNPDDFCLLSTVPEYKKFTLKERLKLHTVMFLGHLYTTMIGKMCLNGLILFMIFLTENFPILAFHRHGYAKSFVDMFVESIGDRTKPMTNAEVLAMMNEPPWYIKYNPFSATHCKSY